MAESLIAVVSSQVWQYIRHYYFVIFPLLFLLHMLHNRYASPLRKYPGPFLASCTRLWQVRVASSGYAEKTYQEVHKQYGPIARIGPNEISFASPYAALELFKTGKGFHKSKFYTVFLPDGRKDIFTEIRESEHALKKRFAVPAYSLASIQKCTSQIEEVMKLFLFKLDGFAASPAPVALDLDNWLHYLAFDTLGQFAFSKTFGFLDKGTDLGGAITAISRSSYESGVIGQIPTSDHFTRRNPLAKFVPFLPPNKAGVFFDTAADALKEYRDVDSEKASAESLLKSLLNSHRQNPEKFTMDDVVAIAMGAVAAGSDSTASTMQTFVWHVLADPVVHKKLADEVLNASLSEIVQYKESIKLPYFQACLKEAMRLQPAVGFNITRMIPPQGAQLDGTWLPGGTQVAVNAWITHRNEKVFGAEPDRYNPERWLQASEEQAAFMERCMLQFGAGSHVCIGRHLALFEMNKTLPQIFRRYEMQLVDPTKPMDHVTGFFYIQSGLQVYVKRRGAA